MRGKEEEEKERKRKKKRKEKIKITNLRPSRSPPRIPRMHASGRD
jgi:hypothetical protein